MSFFNVESDGVLRIKDESDVVLATITPASEVDEYLFDGNNYGNIDYEERRIGVSDWSIWYPDTEDINNTLDENNEVIVPDDEDKALVFTYQGKMQILTIPTVTSPDKDNLNVNSLILGHLWAIEPKTGGLTFYFRESNEDMYEAQTDIQAAGYETKITKAKYITRLTLCGLENN